MASSTSPLCACVLVCAAAVVVAALSGMGAATPLRVNAAAALLHSGQPLHAHVVRDPLSSSFPPPFGRELKKGDDGEDVRIFQFLIYRSMNLSFSVDGKYGPDTEQAAHALQSRHGLKQTGTMTLETAQFVMKHLTRDFYVDDGKTAGEQGYMYKVVIDVHQNRSIESMGHLYAANGTLLFKFPARLHGWDACDCKKPWPDFNSSDDGLTSFAHDGNTPTGLTEFDLNSPEGVPKLYGPYPVNRAVKGLRGNAKFLIPNIRNGILMHTGEWPGWKSPEPMPNSSGCIHTWPQFCKRIADTLVSLGVAVRKNTGGALPYPHKPQGLLSIQQVG